MKFRLLSLILGSMILSSPALAAPGDIYVSGRFDDKVNLFSLGTGAFIKISAQGGGLDNPVGITTGPDGRLYVASGLTNSVIRYNTVTGASVGVFASGGGLANPRDLCFGPDGNLYVASGSTHQVLRYDGLTGAFMGVFAQGGGLNGPVGLRFGPDGNLYVAGGVSNAIYQYNGITGAFIRVFSVGNGLSNPSYFDFSPNGDLFVANFNTNQILRFNGYTGAFKGVFSSTNLTQPIPLRFGPDADIYVGSADTDRVLKYSGIFGSFMKVAAQGAGLDNPNGITFQPSASFVAASFQGLGELPGGVPNSNAYGASGDGRTVVGVSIDGSGSHAYRWRPTTGMIGLGDLPGGGFFSISSGTSGDGNVVVGQSNSSNGPEAFRWVQGGTMQALGDLPGGSFASYAYNVSRDGNVVFGWGTDANGTMAMRWTPATGMVALGDLPGGSTISQAWRSSGNGAVIVGDGSSANGAEAFKWTQATGMVGLGDLPGGAFSSLAHGMSHNGKWIVGQCTSANGPEACLWNGSGGAPQGLGDLPGGQFLAMGWAVTDDGNVVVGRASGPTSPEAFIWIRGYGMMSLKSFLLMQGATAVNTWTPLMAFEISPDGRNVIGDATNPAGTTEAFLAKIKPVPVSVVVNPSPAYGAGTRAIATVSISSPAGPGGMYVAMSSTDPATVSVPPNVVVPEGSSVAKFFVTTNNGTDLAKNVTLRAMANGFQWSSNVTVNGIHAARYQAQTTPYLNKAFSGELYGLSFRYQNTGGNTWSAANGYKLRSINPVDNLNWGINRIEMPAGVTVPAGGFHNFVASARAPVVTTPTNFGIQWNPLQDTFGAFGNSTPNMTVQVLPHNHGSQFVSQNVPLTLPEGLDFSFSINMKNTGGSTWSAANGFQMLSYNPVANTNWGTPVIGINGTTTVAPGQTYTFTSGALFAPDAPGVNRVVNFQWRMAQNKIGFGPWIPNINVIVTPSPTNAQYVSQSGIPSTVAAGSTFTASITMRNWGTAAWTNAGGWGLQSKVPHNNTNWGTNFVPIPAGVTVAPGATYTFTRTYTAPSTPGTYQFRWRMRNSTTAAGFGQYTGIVAVTVS